MLISLTTSDLHCSLYQISAMFTHAFQGEIACVSKQGIQEGKSPTRNAKQDLTEIQQDLPWMEMDNLLDKHWAAELSTFQMWMLSDTHSISEGRKQTLYFIKGVTNNMTDE